MSDINFNDSRNRFRTTLNLEWNNGFLGDGTGIIDDPYWIGSGKMFVRFLTDDGVSLPTLIPGPSRALGVDLIDGLPVSIRYDKGAPYIDNIDTARAVNASIRPTQLPPPSTGNGNGVTQDQFATLRCTQNLSQPSLTVHISGWKPIVNGQMVDNPGSDANLSSFVPGAGLHCAVGVFIKNDMLTSVSFASTPIPLTDDLAVSDVNEVLDQATRTWPGVTLVWVYDVKAGATTILDTDTFLDARQFINIADATAAMATANATATIIASIPIAEGEAATIILDFVGAKSDYSAACGTTISGTVRRAVGGSVTIVGSPTVTTWEDSAGSPTGSIVAAATTLDAKVTGVAAEDWNWRVTYRITKR